MWAAALEEKTAPTVRLRARVYVQHLSVADPDAIAAGNQLPAPRLASKLLAHHFIPQQGVLVHRPGSVFPDLRSAPYIDSPWISWGFPPTPFSRKTASIHKFNKFNQNTWQKLTEDFCVRNFGSKLSKTQF